MKADLSQTLSRQYEYVHVRILHAASPRTAGLAGRSLIDTDCVSLSQRRELPASESATTSRTRCADAAVSARSPEDDEGPREGQVLVLAAQGPWRVDELQADAVLCYSSRPPISSHPEAHLRILWLPLRQDPEVYVQSFPSPTPSIVFVGGPNDIFQLDRITEISCLWAGWSSRIQAMLGEM